MSVSSPIPDELAVIERHLARSDPRLDRLLSSGLSKGHRRRFRRGLLVIVVGCLIVIASFAATVVQPNPFFLLVGFSSGVLVVLAGLDGVVSDARPPRRHPAHRGTP